MPLAKVPKRKKAKKVNFASDLELQEQQNAEQQQHGQQQRFQLARGGHPLGVQPLGNLLLSDSGINVRESGLGAFRRLSDELILDLLALLPAKELLRLGTVSKALYVFSNQQELWRGLTLADFSGDFDFRDSWKQTYLHSVSSNGAHEGDEAAPTPTAKQPFKVSAFYSDYLFQSHLCASLSLRPDWLSRDNIPRRANLSLSDFVSEFESPNRPVIITDALSKWPAMAKWDEDYLVRTAGNAKFAVGPVSMHLDKFYAYASAAQEERPLYVFDSKFVESVPQLGKDFDVPEYFQEDLFSLLGPKGRPDHRWLIIGPARSGSSWHIDPNSTSAWNAVIRGAKKWILFPPSSPDNPIGPPPGVLPSPDGADVACPVSIPEWFMNFYGQLRSCGVRGVVEGVCKEGEVIFVPRGWWHMVFNLETSVAVTQNYVSRRNLLSVLDFLSRPNASALVSGTDQRESLHQRFKDKFEATYPGEIAALVAEEQRKQELKRRNICFWESASDKKGGAFKFGFS